MYRKQFIEMVEEAFAENGLDAIDYEDLIIDLADRAEFEAIIEEDEEDEDEETDEVDL